MSTGVTGDLESQTGQNGGAFFADAVKLGWVEAESL
jgi:hypothetical protein